MLQAGGIDKLVEQKADAYRGNPQALQKRYSQNQELMDLLAMQKLKTEKEAASRDMQLKAEQTPSTIAEQYEQQLVGMNKDEMAGQVAGVLGQKQKQAQQKQQAMGMPPQKPQGQRPPMPQGAPQGIASQPRPNMQGMAQGGIIGYVAGGEVSEKDIEEWLKNNPSVFPQATPARRRQEAIKQIGKAAPAKRAATSESISVSAAEREAFREANPNVFPQAEDKKIDELIKAEKYGKRDLQGRSGAPASTESAAAAAQKIKGIAGLEPSAVEQLAKANAPAPDPTATGLGDPRIGAGTVLAAPAPAGQDDAANAVAVATGQTIGQPSAGFGASSDMSIDQQLQGVLNTAAPDTSTLSKKQLSTALGDSFMGKVEDRIEVNPEAKSEATLDRYASDDVEKGGYGVKKYEEGLAKYLTRKEELDEAQLDPEAVARERTNAGIRGLISGGTGRGASIARGKFDDNVSKRQRAVITEQRDMFVKNKEATSVVLDKINKGAADALKLYTEDVSAGMDLMANVTKGDLEMYQKEADRMYNQNQNGIKNKIDALKVSSQANLQKMIQEQASIEEVSSALEGLIKQNKALREEHFKALQPEMTRLNSIIYDEDSPAAKVTLAKGQLAAMEGTFQVIEDKTRTDDAITIYEDLIKMLRDQGGYSTTMVQQLQNQVSQKLGTSQGTSQRTSQGGSVTQRAAAALSAVQAPTG